MLTFTAIMIILCISLGITGIAVLFLIKNDKRAKEMKLEIGEEVDFSLPMNRIGKVIEDKGNTIRIEIEVPRHLVSKIKK